MRQTLLTGATGFIGGYVLERLLAEGDAVTLLQRSSAPVLGISPVVFDGLAADDIAKVLAGRSFDRIIHLAGYGVAPGDRDLALMQAINVDLPVAMADYARRGGAGALFIAGSGSEYAAPQAGVLTAEDRELETVAPYGDSKARGTVDTLEFAAKHNLPVAVGRFFGVYGAGEAPHRLLPAIYRGFKAGQRVPLSDGMQMRDVISVDDAARAVLALADSPGRDCYNICSGQPLSVRHFAEAIATSLGADRDLLGFGDIARRPYETMWFVGNGAKLRKATGWQPAFGLEEGLARAIARLDALHRS